MAKRPSGFRIDDPAWALVQALISYWGVTTAAGGAGGATLVCADLVNQPEFDGNQVVIISGPYGGQARDINGTTLLGTVTPASNFGGVITANTIFAILPIRTVPAEVAALVALVNAIETKAEATQYYDRVFYDSVIGIAGTDWPIGTPQVPSDVIADIITICAARNLKVIDVHGTLTLGAAMAHYTFVGHRHEDVTDTFDLNGQDLDSSILSKCVITGAQGAVGLLTLEDCLVYLLTNFQGIANNCDLYGSAMSLRTASYADLQNCNSVHSDLTITVNAPTRASFKKMAGNCTFTGQTGGVLYIRGYKGTLVIDAMTGGTCDIYANGADITINANCDAPSVISIYGNARVTIVGAPTATINDYTKETQLSNTEHETEWSSTPTIEALANAAAVALTVGSITPTYPTGATRVRAILLATIHVANKTAAVHHIKFKIEGQKAGGGYLNQLNLTAQEGLSMVEADGATDGWSGAIDVTALVDTSGAVYDFRFEVDSDNAGNVIYICGFVLALVYTM